MKALVTTLLLALAATLHAAVETYEIDPAHSTIGFEVRHFFTKVPGRFNDFTATLKLDSEQPEKSSVDVVVLTKSIDTANEKRDQHLRTADFFDVEKFPTMTFKSTKVEKTGGDTAKVTGDLTLHGVTKPVTLDVTLLGKGTGMQGGTITGWSANAKIIRKDFGLDWGKVVEGTAVVSDEVIIGIEVEAAAK